MNMKKLIEQADFDNVEQISKRWKKQLKGSPIKQTSSDLAEILNSNEVQKENVQNSNNVKLSYPAQKDNSISESALQSNQNNNKKRQVMPQVIDQDTEHFRNRLQHLLNSFKTDAVGQFMGMKKAMLEYQKDTIKTDTQKYLQMYQQKHQELLTTKQSLITTSKELQKKTIQVELMSNYISKLNQRIKAVKYLSRPFSLLYENRVEEQTLKIKYKQAQRSDDRRIHVKAFSGWRNVWRQAKQEQQKQSNQKRINDEVKDIVNRLNKEMQMLREQLNESLRKNQEYENNKHLVQENLKKAFLRGMCAMNMEAMGVLGDNESISQQNNQSMMNHSMMNMTNMSQMAMTQQNTAHKNLGQSNIVHAASDKFLNNSVMNNTSSLMMGKVKTESKEHKWRQAPIMGIEQNEECQEPRPILVKPSNEGKVIKIVDGRSSAVQIKKIPPPPVCSKQAINSTKEIKQPITNRSSIVNSRKNG